MKIVCDTHCHTIGSGHAYNTITEMAYEASKKGLELIAMTDHGPSAPGAPNSIYFRNLKVIPDYLHGVRILKGCEANIVDFDGNLDLSKNELDHLEIVIASFHDIVVKPGTIDENTQAYINVLKNPSVDIIGHIDNGRFSVDFEKVIKCAKEENKIIELNNSSFTVRQSQEDVFIKIANLCKQYEVKITTGSDAHFSTNIGKLDRVMNILEITNFPDELVLTTSTEKLLKHLNIE